MGKDRQNCIHETKQYSRKNGAALGLVRNTTNTTITILNTLALHADAKSYLGLVLKVGFEIYGKHDPRIFS